MTITRAEAFHLLQVSQDASQEEIKSSYRKLALKYHPDKNKDNEGAKRLFQRINAAYNLLTGDEDINCLTEEEIVSLFQKVIQTEWFTFLSQNFDFSDDSDYYDSEEELISHEQWEQIEKKAQKNAEKLVDEEEQEKKKLEKKRERRKKHKQRRKEKKREEKESSKSYNTNAKDKYEINDVSNVQIIKKGNVTNSPKVVNSPKKSKEQVVESDSDTPEIDLGSAFCSKVKQKVEKSEARTRKASEKIVNGDDNSCSLKRSSPSDSVSESITSSKTSTNSTNNSKQSPPQLNNPTLPEQPTEENFLKSQEHARKGNEFAQFGKYHNAIEEYTKAISLNKTDHRCFGNRSYCYHSLKKFEEALNDANSATALVPNEPKGYFRKAKALCGLKRFSEAENALNKILELDPDCSEAAHELFEVRLLQLQDFGFDRRACEHALIKSKNDIQGAIEFLLSSQFKDNMSFTTTEYDERPPPPPQMPPPIYPNISHLTSSQMASFFPLIPAGSYTASPIRMPSVAPGTRPPMVQISVPMQVPYPRPQNIPINNIPVSTIMRVPPPPMPSPMHQQPPLHPLKQSFNNHPQMSVRPNTMAVRAGNKHQPHNHHIRVSNEKHHNMANGKAGRKFDPRDYSLWIGHFDSKKVTEKDLYEVFAKYGKVSGVVIIKTHGKPLAYSFIHFMRHEDAKRAFNAAQNHVIQGVSLDVNWNKNPTIECEHWLRGNCPYSNCHYLHVSDHDQYR